MKQEDFTLLLLQAHISVSAENGATLAAGQNMCCTQPPSFHTLLNYPTGRFFILPESRPYLPFLAYPEVLTSGGRKMQSVITLGICSPIVSPVPMLRCHAPQVSAKSIYLSLKECSRGNHRLSWWPASGQCSDLESCSMPSPGVTHYLKQFLLGA